MKPWIQILMLTIVLCSLTLSTPSHAQSKSTQLQCRAKAKETAKIAYDQCLSVAKEDEALNIRKEYKAKLAKLKEYYEQKLKKLNLKAKSEVKTATANPAAEVSSVLPQKSITTEPATETAGTNFNTPTPVNTQESFSAPATAALPTTESLPADSNEPIIRLKEAPAPTEGTQQLESAPELTI